jgi:hypothetical protein
MPLTPIQRSFAYLVLLSLVGWPNAATSDLDLTEHGGSADTASGHSDPRRAGGSLLWEDRFGAPETDEFPGQGAIAAGDRAVFVSGGAGGDVLVRAHRAKDGELLWADTFDRSGGFDDALGITLARGRVFVLGGADLPANSRGTPLIRAYESETGRLLWHQELFAGDGVFDSAVVRGRRVVAIGGNSAWLVQAYDTDTGAPLWGDRFGNGVSNRAIGVAEHAGRVFVGGRARPPGATLNWLVRAYDAASGQVLWEDYAGGGISGQATSLAVGGNRVIAVGQCCASDWLVRTYDARTGEIQWEDVVDKGGSAYPELALDVAILGGRAFVAGGGGAGCKLEVAAQENCDFIVRAYDLRSGRLLWEDQHDLSLFDVSTSVAAEDGSVFAVGLGGNDCDNSGLTNCDLLIRAYQPRSGRVLWEDQVDSGENDFGQGVAAAGGRVFAAGFILDLDFFTDLLLRAYAARGRHDADDLDD